MRKELIGLVLFFFVILAVVSLVSYSPHDPSLNFHTFSSSHQVENSFGLVGAFFAGSLIDLFGIGAFWVPVLLIMAMFWYFRGRSNTVLSLTVVGGLLLVVSTGSLLALFHDQYAVGGTLISARGFIVSPLADFLVAYANRTGGILFLILMLSIGIVLATGVSLFTLITMARTWVVQCLRSGLSQGQKHSNEIASLCVRNFKDWRIRRQERLKLIELKPVPVIAGAEPGISRPKEKEASEKSGVDSAVIRQTFQETDSPRFTGIKDIREQGSFVLPPASLLNDKKSIKQDVNVELLKKKGEILENKLGDFGISGHVVEILPGPVITTFEYKPAAGVKISKIVNLTDDLALALRALSIRIIAPIPGKDVVGVEIPNEKRETVVLKDLITSAAFIESSSKLTLGLGKDILGAPIAAQMDSMPHLLIAGATGTGKSVGLNAMIISLLYKASPDEVKFIMIDPKRIELSVYDGIPHLITPVVTDMKKATNALFWGVREMERRYELLAESGVRNILQYNASVERIKAAPRKTDENGEDVPFPEKLPYIVVIVDEFADLMMVASRDVESALIRLAQMARAAGIHLILATQRPSVDVLTGVIKANFPTRISFQVSSKIDSRTILDTNGSERLLGNGDMLFLPPGTGRLQRIQGAYISEAEIARVTEFLKRQQQPDYLDDVTEKAENGTSAMDESDYDEKYDEAVALVTKTRQASISSVQRHLRIGYNRAARIIEVMEAEGIIGPSDGSKAREVLVRDYDGD